MFRLQPLVQWLKFWLGCLHCLTQTRVCHVWLWMHTEVVICTGTQVCSCTHLPLQVLGSTEQVQLQLVSHIPMDNMLPGRAWEGTERSTVLGLIQHHVSEMVIDYFVSSVDNKT